MNPKTRRNTTLTTATLLLTAASILTTPPANAKTDLPIWDPCQTMTWYVKGNKKLVKNYQKNLTQSFKTLTKKTGIKFQQTTNQNTAMTTIKIVKGNGSGLGGYDVTWSNETGAVKDPRINTGGYISLATTAKASPKARKHLIMHEMLHVLGLGHNNIKGSIMYPSYTWDTKAKFYPVDNKNLKKISPKHNPCTPPPSPWNTEITAVTNWTTYDLGGDTYYEPITTITWNSNTLPENTAGAVLIYENHNTEEKYETINNEELQKNKTNLNGVWCGPDQTILVQTITGNKHFETKNPPQTIPCQTTNMPNQIGNNNIQL